VLGWKSARNWHSTSRSASFPRWLCRPDALPNTELTQAFESLPADQLPHGIAGTYTMTAASGQSLPATIAQRPGCHLAMVSGSLRLESGRFDFSNTIQETCDGRGTQRTTHRAHGTYVVDDRRLRLEAAADGMSFGLATGTIEGDTIRIAEVRTEGGAQSVSWVLRRG
jgi:hypothetical protein